MRYNRKKVELPSSPSQKPMPLTPMSGMIAKPLTYERRPRIVEEEPATRERVIEGVTNVDDYSQERDRIAGQDWTDYMIENREKAILNPELLPKPKLKDRLLTGLFQGLQDAYAASIQNPGMSGWEALGRMGAGTAGAAMNPQRVAEMQNQQELEQLYNQQGMTYKRRKAQADLLNAGLETKERVGRIQKTQAETKALNNKGSNREYKQIGDTWYLIDEKGNREVVTGADGRPITARSYESHLDPNTGELVVLDRNSQQVQRFPRLTSGRMKQITEKDLPRTRFGLPAQSDIENYEKSKREYDELAKKAAVENTSVESQLNILKGQIDTLKGRIATLKGKQVDPYDASGAKARDEAIRRDEDEIRNLELKMQTLKRAPLPSAPKAVNYDPDVEKLYQDLLLQVNSLTPKPDAKDVPLSKVADWFDLILKESNPKLRSEKYKRLVESLQNLNVVTPRQ